MTISKTFAYNGHEGSVYTLETGNEQGTFYSGGGDKVVSLWHLRSETPTGIVATTSVIYCIRLLKDKQQLVIGVSGGGFHVVDILQKKELRFIVHHVNGVFDIAYLSKQNKIVTAGADGKIALWSAEDFTLLKSFSLCNGKIRSLALNADETLLAAGCGDGHIRVFSTDAFEMIKDIPAHTESTNSVAFHPDGKRLISGGKDAHLRSWSLDSFEMLSEVPAHNYAIYSIVFSPDKKLMVTASRDKTLKLWNSDDLSFINRIDKLRFDAHSHSVNKVLWLEADALISAGDDRKIFQWKVE